MSGDQLRGFSRARCVLGKLPARVPVAEGAHLRSRVGIRQRRSKLGHEVREEKLPAKRANALIGRRAQGAPDHRLDVTPLATYGAMFFINGAYAGLELFDAASTWRKLAAKVIRSYRRRTRSPPRAAQATKTARAEGVRDSCRSRSGVGVPAIGEGSDVRLSGTDRAGAALVAGGRVIHPCAFPVAD
jgi:hypothetical protein